MQNSYSCETCERFARRLVLKQRHMRLERNSQSFYATGPCWHIFPLFSLALARSDSRHCSVLFRFLSLALTRSASQHCSVLFRLLFLALSRSLSQYFWPLSLCLLHVILALCRSLSRSASCNPGLRTYYQLRYRFITY